MKQNITHKGKVYMWWGTYKRKALHSFHLSADETGCKDLLKLIDNLENSVNIINIDSLPQTQSRSGLPVRGMREIKTVLFKLAPKQNDDLSLVKFDEGCEFSLSPNGLAILRSGILDIQKGDGDWALVGTANSIWFWPLAWHNL